jgi:hypothetical protein
VIKKLKRRQHLFLILVLVLIFLFIFEFLAGDPMIVIYDFKKSQHLTEATKSSSEEWRISSNKLVSLKGYAVSDRDFDISNINETERNKIKLFFLLRGYKSDPLNTTKHYDTTPYNVEFVGYRRENIYCLLSLRIFCGEIDQEQENLREVFIKDFLKTSPEFAMHYNSKSSDMAVVINVKNVVGDYAEGTDNTYEKGVYLPSGSSWIAIKLNGKWTIIKNSQELPMCSLVDKYKVPKEIYMNCYINSNYDTRFEN